MPIYLGVPSYFLFSTDFFFVNVLLLSLVIFLQFMGVETDLNLFRTFLNFSYNSVHTSAFEFCCAGSSKDKDQLVGRTADESLKIATKQLSGVVYGV